MSLENTFQPQLIGINEKLRLRCYDGVFETFLPGYQNPAVYQNSEGIFDEAKIPDLSYVERMCRYLSNEGELYYIEYRSGEDWIPIGDVTIKPENPPIAIWFDEYRGRGIGTNVMQKCIERMKTLGYQRITNSTVYTWNLASQRLHEKLGFQKTRVEGNEIYYDLDLSQPE